MTSRSSRAATYISLLLVFAAWPLAAKPAGAPAPPPVIVVNPTPGDCFSGPGCLDSSFGTGGKIQQNVGGANQDAYVSALQPDGKLLVGGTTNVGSDYLNAGSDGQLTIARFNTDGTLDANFGAAGVVTVDRLKAANYPTNFEQVRGIAVQSDGNILVASFGTSFSPAGGYLAVLRLTPSGSFDTSFGSGGTAVVASGSSAGTATGIKLQSDGKILLLYTGTAASVVRLKTNGAIDTTFGSHGTATASNCGSIAIALQSDGKIIIAGNTGPVGSYDFIVCRLTTSGSLDSSFGSHGITAVDFFGGSDVIGWNGLSVAADNSIVVAGWAPAADNSVASRNIALAQLTANGALSTSFGSGGRVVLDMWGNQDVAEAVAIQPDGKIVFAGKGAVPDGSHNYAVVGRLTSSGALDTSFGSGGVAATEFTQHNLAYALALSNGMITVAGSTSNGTVDTAWFVARYFQ